MSTANKLNWVIGIVMVFLVILATNLIDRNNFRVVKESVVSVYEDRLVAKGVLYDVLAIIHKKEQAILLDDENFFKTKNQQLNTELADRIAIFDQTILTNKEEAIYEDFKSNIKDLQVLELKKENFDTNPKPMLLKSIAAVKVNLDKLAAIQQEEGRNQLDVSNHAMDAIELFTQIEVYMLILLAIVMLAIILYQPKKRQA